METANRNGASVGDFTVVGSEVRANCRLALESLFGADAAIQRIETVYSHKIGGRIVPIHGEWFYVRLDSHAAACAAVGLE